MPVLRDNVDSYDWWKPPANIDSLGYGSNGFHFTLAYGRGAFVDSWAEWSFRSVDAGCYSAEAWIPSDWATAHVRYDFRSGGQDIGNSWLNQEEVRGWQSLGLHRLSGDVQVRIQDNVARDDWRDDGPVRTRMAADAIRLVPAAGCDGTIPPSALIDDMPVLRDNVDSYDWWKPPANIDSLGYGSNGFHFTLAYGRGAFVDSWAEWSFRSVDAGCYSAEAWIPSDWATAHVRYDFRSGGQDIGNSWLNQEEVRGWQSLGLHRLSGDVQVRIQDNVARDDWRDDGPVRTRMAADAIRLVPAAGC